MRQMQIEPEVIDDIVKRVDSGEHKSNIAARHNISNSFVTKIIARPEYYRNRQSTNERLRTYKTVKETSITTGACCSACEVYYVTPHGYKVICESCLKHYGGNPPNFHTTRVISTGGKMYISFKEVVFVAINPEL